MLRQKVECPHFAGSQCHAGAYLGRYVIVVDDDIDPTNNDDVFWPIGTRSEPEQDIDIIRRCWSGPLDPVVHPSQKGFNSRAIIDACRPFEWMKDSPTVAESSTEVLQATEGRGVNFFSAAMASIDRQLDFCRAAGIKGYPRV